MESKIINGECLEEMNKLPDRCVDLIITSPPYEDISGAGYNGSKKDILFFKLYSDFVDKLFKEKYPEKVKARKYANYHNQKDSKCSNCKSSNDLHFHHTNYKKNEGVTLCKECHNEVHKNDIIPKTN